jgi:hypothetical protein
MTVNVDVYCDVFQEFANQLHEWGLTLGNFQQDGATCHTPNRALEEIESFFGDKVI